MNHDTTLLVGAYERDNFGDTLFKIVTSALLSPRITTPTSPFARPMTPYDSDATESYIAHGSTGAREPIWIVGGEVGGTRMSEAAKFSGQEVPKNLTDMSPYLPRNFTGGHYVVNSVGLSGIRSLRGIPLLNTIEVLSSADFISVREKRSAAILRKLKITHQVAPDVVHTLPSLGLITPSEKSDYVLFQGKEKLLSEYGLTELCTSLGSLDVLRTKRLVLFPAGIAEGHDSLKQYEQIKSMLSKINKNIKVEIYTDPDPIRKAQLIADAYLWIGTSLHGLIISTAFGTPAVSMRLRKLTTYARSWGISNPTDVAVSDLEHASQYALSLSRNPHLQRLANDLTQKALENFDLAKKGLEVSTPKSRNSSELARRPSYLDLPRSVLNLARMA